MRYLIVEKEKGLFLGSFKNVALFADSNVFPIIKVPSFDTTNDAEHYIANYLPKEAKQYGVIEIKSNTKYVSIIEIIRQGYAEYTHGLIDYLPMQSENVH
jgi:hypothetical protein